MTGNTNTGTMVSCLLGGFYEEFERMKYELFV
jgi:hypothetical protein